MNSSDKFCYVCGEMTFASRKCVDCKYKKNVYSLYFGCKVGDQGTTGMLHYLFIKSQRMGKL
jgi:hypothetical protein